MGKGGGEDPPFHSFRNQHPPSTLMNTQQQPLQASALLPQQSALQSLVVKGEIYCKYIPTLPHPSQSPWLTPLLHLQIFSPPLSLS